MSSMHLAWKEFHCLAHGGIIVISTMTEVPGSKHGLNLNVKLQFNLFYYVDICE